MFSNFFFVLFFLGTKRIHTIIGYFPYLYRSTLPAGHPIIIIQTDYTGLHIILTNYLLYLQQMSHAQVTPFCSSKKLTKKKKP